MVTVTCSVDKTLLTATLANMRLVNALAGRVTESIARSVPHLISDAESIT